jgi:hypothetical protein
MERIKNGAARAQKQIRRKKLRGIIIPETTRGRVKEASRLEEGEKSCRIQGAGSPNSCLPKKEDPLETTTNLPRNLDPDYRKNLPKILSLKESPAAAKCRRKEERGLAWLGLGGSTEQQEHIPD